MGNFACVSAFNGILMRAKEKQRLAIKSLLRKDMHMAAAKMIQVLRSTAQSYALPASVMSHFDSLDTSSIIEMPDGSSIIYIYFGGDLHRDSLAQRITPASIMW